MAQPEPHAQRPRRLRRFLRRSRDPSSLGFEIDRAALKDAAIVVLPVALLVIGAFWLASRYVKPAPPDTFVMATGAEGGAYHLFGQRYRDILAREGVRVELKTSAGSIENLALLADPYSAVEAAFVQGGVASSENIAGLVSLGSVYYEPLWIFHRFTTDLEALRDLRGRRIAVGAQGSGTRPLALQLLRAVGIDAAPTVLEPLGAAAAAQALIAGRLDAAFIVAGPDAPVVQQLINADGVRLLHLANAQAFARRFPHLGVLTLPRGVIDLAAQKPERDVALLAATANIVVRADFHPALAFLLLNAATEVHSSSGILQRHREFPAARESEFVLSDEAQRYFRDGPPLLRRYLPYWLANFVDRMLVLLVPLLAVLIPAVRILPGLIAWRIKSRVFRWYGEIKYLENEIEHSGRERVADMLARLDAIERGVEHTSVPRAYADYAYNLRIHIDVVRQRVLRLAQADSGETESGAEEGAGAGGANRAPRA